MLDRRAPAKLALLAVLFFLGAALDPAAAAVGPSGLAGVWSVEVETPNGSLRLDLDLTTRGDALAGSLSFLRATLPLERVHFRDPKLEAEIDLGGSILRATGLLAGGRLSGEWSVPGRDLRGIWSAERKSSAAKGGAVDDIVGFWPVMLYLPNGALNLTLDLKRIDGTLVGALGGEAGTLPLQSIVLDGETLRFKIDLMGETYRFDCTVKDHKLEGRWLAGGAWRSAGKVPADTKTKPRRNEGAKGAEP